MVLSKVLVVVHGEEWSQLGGTQRVGHIEGRGVIFHTFAVLQCVVRGGGIYPWVLQSTGGLERKSFGRISSTHESPPLQLLVLQLHFWGKP